MKYWNFDGREMSEGRAADGYFDEDGYDAVVVGSGYGGAVAACRLAMAGIKVCLIEKGKKWEANDFPTHNYQMWSKMRLESATDGVSFGPKDALFQLYEQGNSFAGVICGLGGGSLANAGVMVSTPIRSKKDPRWPKEWHKKWEAHEALALTMLNPQDPPVEFAGARARAAVAEDIEESSPTPIKQTINFISENAPNLKGTKQLDQCVACGNCMSGCPYNAKNSNDKNYIALAIEAGCKVITQCEVQYIVKDVDEEYVGGNIISGKKLGRWRVHVDNLEYVCADFVVLSAGVMGTTQILFQSERRGLNISNRLGMGFSSNGNNFAYLAGISVPMNGQGLSKEQFSDIPFQYRPGPSISSSFTSSLGYTIESAVVPKAYPQFLLKRIFTFGWPNQYWFLHCVIDKLKQMMGVKPTQGLLLSLMGYDEGNGTITLDKATDKIRFSTPDDPLRTRKMKAIHRITKRLGGTLFMSRYQSTSFHLLGGCNVASDPSHGVCNPNGQVFTPQGDQKAVHQGLYVCDASLIPCPIGINPGLSIISAAEHVSSHLVDDILKYKSLNQPTVVPNGEVQLPLNQHDLRDFSQLPARINGSPIMEKRYNEVLIKETMVGHLGGMPCTAYLIMKVDSKAWNKARATMGDSHPILRGKVGGYVLSEFVPKDRLYIIDGTVDMCSVDCRTPYTQYMHYRLLLASPSGSRYILEGNKIMNPYFLALNAWNETRTLHVTFKEVHPNDATKFHQETASSKESLDLTGELHLSARELLRSLVTMKGRQRGRFIYRLLQSFLRTYLLQTPRMPTHVDFSSYELTERSYPPHILHKITTSDGFVITSKQWIPNGETKKHPVLLLNGYSTESFWCPTEPRDLIRTLLDEGYEPWLLQVRLHPLNPSNDFTIEDIGKFDIPAAFAKIHELHGPSTKVHVIAHCVGGVSFHISLLGGHISTSDIISLSCTNSSMFFKVTAYSLFKMSLPLLPISMAILGTNKILPLYENIIAIPRHRLLKSIFRLMPRYERCSCDECEVFAGIFGNTFWHQNITPTMHHFLHKKSLPQVPLAGLPHLTKICVKGHIVNAKGEDIYLIHPERMTLPTLYISGGRSILVTPETSFLANQYMKLHQPKFRHRRVVVEGFGHSDLLIGEESYKKVFPHMISHMKLAEEEINGENGVNMENYNNFEETMLWANSNEEKGRVGALVSLIGIVVFVVLMGAFLSRMKMKY